MPAPLDPPERARESLQAARANGQPFTPAWHQARQTALQGLGDWQNDKWEEVLGWARPYFRAAYQRDPAHRCGHQLCCP